MSVNLSTSNTAIQANSLNKSRKVQSGLPATKMAAKEAIKKTLVTPSQPRTLPPLFFLRSPNHHSIINRVPQRVLTACHIMRDVGTTNRSMNRMDAYNALLVDSCDKVPNTHPRLWYGIFGWGVTGQPVRFKDPKRYEIYRNTN
ncbi:hypothetical protein BDZ97DRAFT_1403927 [Flammula alnicola]|nr:hypothetical protein BDZ97DRAFT_1403927 [Flammula alnicola]